jgi:hypothetical protein
MMGFLTLAETQLALPESGAAALSFSLWEKVDRRAAPRRMRGVPAKWGVGLSWAPTFVALANTFSQEGRRC